MPVYFRVQETLPGPGQKRQGCGKYPFGPAGLNTPKHFSLSDQLTYPNKMAAFKGCHFPVTDRS